MCRFVAYLGKEKMLLDKVLGQPENSLIKQSRNARDSEYSVNADGFGIAWYDSSIDETPGVFKSIQPAWNDTNLIHLSKKIKSDCFLAHIRASTVGDVSKSNCHPFTFGRYSMVHNGTIRNFDKIKQSLISTLNDDLFLHIKGTTDSECLFLLIIHFLKAKKQDLVSAVKDAIAWVVDAQARLGDKDFSKINIAITDGRDIVATRFASKGSRHLSLSYHDNPGGNPESFIISSESLYESEGMWQLVPENSYLFLRQSDMKLEIGKLF